MTEVQLETGPLVARLAANTLVQVVGNVAGSIVGFATFVAVTRGLGPEAFGNFTAATVFLFIPAVLSDVGLSMAVLREISAKPERTENVMRASLPLRAIVSVVAVGVAVAIALALPFNEQIKVATLIASVGTVLTLMTLALQPVLEARLKMHLAVGATLTGRLLTLGLTLGALAAGLGFKSIVAAYSAGLAVTFLLYLLAVARLIPLRPVVDLQYWRRLLTGSLVLGMAIALSLVYFRVDTVLLALLRSPEEVGFYGAAYKFIELSALVGGAAAISMFPPLARFVAAGDERAPRLLQKTFDILLAVAAPLVVVMLVYPEELVVLAAGSEFREGGRVLPLLAPYVLFSFANTVLWRVLIAFSRDYALLVFSICVLVLNVILNLIFIPEYGMRAAAVIAVVSEALVTIPIALAVRREGLLPGLRNLPPVAIATAGMLAVALLWRDPLLLGAAAAGTVYAALLLLVPGAARDIILKDLLPAGRRIIGREKPT